MDRMAGKLWQSNREIAKGNNKCTHFEDQVTVVTLWELAVAFFRNGLSSGFHMGGNIPISISPSSEESFFFCLLPHSLLNGSLSNFTDNTCHTNARSHYLPNSLYCPWRDRFQWQKYQKMASVSLAYYGFTNCYQVNTTNCYQVNTESRA